MEKNIPSPTLPRRSPTQSKDSRIKSTSSSCLLTMTKSSWVTTGSVTSTPTSTGRPKKSKSPPKTKFTHSKSTSPSNQIQQSNSTTSWTKKTSTLKKEIRLTSYTWTLSNRNRMLKQN